MPTPHGKSSLPLELKVIPHPTFPLSNPLLAAQLTKFNDFPYPHLPLWLSEVPGKGTYYFTLSFGVSFLTPTPPSSQLLLHRQGPGDTAASSSTAL